MNFNLKHLILIAIVVALLISFVTRTFEVELSQVYSTIAISPDGSKVAVQGKTNTQVFDCKTKKRLSKFKVFCDLTPEHVEFADDNHVLTFGFGPGDTGVCRTVRWHEFKSGLQVRAFPRMSTIEHFSPARDGFVYTNNGTREVSFHSLDPFEKKPLATNDINKIFGSTLGLYHSRPMLHGFYNGTAEDILTTEPSWPSTTEIEDLAGDGSVKAITDLAVRVRVAPDGTRFAVENKDVFSMHEMSGKVLWKSTVKKPSRTQFSANGKFVGVETYGKSPTVFVFNTLTGKLRSKLVTARDQQGAPFAISNDGILAISRTGLSYSGVELWDTANNQQLGHVGVTLSKPNWLLPGLLNTMLFLIWCGAWVLAKKKLYKNSWHSRLASSWPCGIGLILGTALVFFAFAIFTYTVQDSILQNRSYYWGNALFPALAIGVGTLVFVVPSLRTVLGRSPIGPQEK